MTDYTRLNIKIDGDNSGFRRSMNQTQRETDKFVRSPSFMEIAAAVGVGRFIPSAAGGAFNNFTKQMKNLRQQFQSGGGMQALMQSHELGRVGRFLQRRLYPMDKGGSAKGADQLDRAMEMSDAMKAFKGSARTALVSTIVGAAPMILAGSLAAITAVVYKLWNNTKRFDTEAKQFSGPVMIHDALLEQQKTLLQIKRGQDPAYIQQQIDLANADYRLSMAGTRSGGGNVLTSMEIAIKNAIAYYMEGMSRTGNPALINYFIGFGNQNMNPPTSGGIK